VPLRISPGVWWIGRNDAISGMLFDGAFERDERRLVCQLLKPGMTVLDVGANAGLYTMTAARLVGRTGRVIAFEPSARERARLARHLHINRLTNVVVEPSAVGAVDGEVDLFVVDGHETGCNSLRLPPGEQVRPSRVPVCRLDTYAAHHDLTRVDFVKIDVEGGERDALLGAEQLFRRARPFLMCEIEPARIAPWHYDPREIFELVQSWDYRWFAIGADGAVPMSGVPESCNGNYLATSKC
jgi:FkbM family methyltransferase